MVEHGLEGRQVAVNIGEDSDAHRIEQLLHFDDRRSTIDGSRSSIVYRPANSDLT
jgi:hypothetical protein